MRSELLEEARPLTVTERIELVEAIWDTVAEDADLERLPVPDWHREELDRRLADLESETTRWLSIGRGAETA